MNHGSNLLEIVAKDTTKKNPGLTAQLPNPDMTVFLNFI